MLRPASPIQMVMQSKRVLPAACLCSPASKLADDRMEGLQDRWRGVALPSSSAGCRGAWLAPGVQAAGTHGGRGLQAAACLVRKDLETFLSTVVKTKRSKKP